MLALISRRIMRKFGKTKSGKKRKRFDVWSCKNDHRYIGSPGRRPFCPADNEPLKHGYRFE